MNTSAPRLTTALNTTGSLFSAALSSYTGFTGFQDHSQIFERRIEQARGEGRLYRMPSLGFVGAVALMSTQLILPYLFKLTHTNSPILVVRQYNHLFLSSPLYQIVNATFLAFTYLNACMHCNSCVNADSSAPSPRKQLFLKIIILMHQIQAFLGLGYYMLYSVLNVIKDVYGGSLENVFALHYLLSFLIGYGLFTQAKSVVNKEAENFNSISPSSESSTEEAFLSRLEEGRYINLNNRRRISLGFTTQSAA